MAFKLSFSVIPKAAIFIVTGTLQRFLQRHRVTDVTEAEQRLHMHAGREVSMELKLRFSSDIAKGLAFIASNGEFFRVLADLTLFHFSCEVLPKE